MPIGYTDTGIDTNIYTDRQTPFKKDRTAAKGVGTCTRMYASCVYAWWVCMYLAAYEY